MIVWTKAILAAATLVACRTAADQAAVREQLLAADRSFAFTTAAKGVEGCGSP
jgi:hypothetical protein